jgi:hypothetical protein
VPIMTEPKRPTADQLRHDIDRGRTGDKLPWSDPASAPLGTDEEAAGTPFAAGDIDAARRAERRGFYQVQPDAGLGHAWILVGFILALFAGILVWFIAIA